ncbi:MAG: 4-alpha-glucanotransferase [Candidatus Vogelbacteria bacterium CG10_big_fil_rev_8_21_14_0_10_45_14]|uniref:4-alpha-glucanotransferase n=1 Tax=Candidatus Vogelbacteria bacterium CG10_big_fil_rev_8_21_14_0_10_45_14 TaxID=1975042 RepID=A0A2H0RKL7_9BACT|nr:MAG: 4-alpha-glucanotransferase [Candidatus Vogelbacteria bacterium CG10_big_fil_rev_8_21_14_0_10_45_14]
MFGWEYPPHHSGGLGVACFGLTRALSSLGAEIVLVLPKRVAMLGNHLRARFAGLEQLSLKGGRATPSCYASSGEFQGAYGRSLFAEVEAYAKASEQIAKEESFDVIHAHDWLTALSGVATKRQSGKPLFFHVHATEFDRSGGTHADPEVYKIEKLGMDEADKVITVSEYTKKILVSKYFVDPEKVLVIHNGIDSDYFDILSSAELASNEEQQGESGRIKMFVDKIHENGGKLVLFAGRITLQKGPDYFVRLAKEIATRRPKTYFLIAGTGDMEGQVISAIAQSGLSDKCFYFGRYKGSETSSLFRSADLYVFPSVSEPFGITPLEAAQSGAPVLMSKQSGVAEVFRNVLLVDFWDMDEMVNKSITLLDNPALAQTLRNEAMAELPNLTWINPAKKLLSNYQYLVSSKLPSMVGAGVPVSVGL